jgi:hypothetical protein
MKLKKNIGTTQRIKQLLIPKSLIQEQQTGIHSLTLDTSLASYDLMIITTTNGTQRKDYNTRGQ